MPSLLQMKALTEQSVPSVVFCTQNTMCFWLAVFVALNILEARWSLQGHWMLSSVESVSLTLFIVSNDVMVALTKPSRARAEQHMAFISGAMLKVQLADYMRPSCIYAGYKCKE